MAYGEDRGTAGQSQADFDSGILRTAAAQPAPASILPPNVRSDLGVVELAELLVERVAQRRQV